VDFKEAEMWLGVMGVGGTIATLGALAFILLTVHAVFLGKSNKGRAMTAW
jgi:hypothetical protein